MAGESECYDTPADEFSRRHLSKDFCEVTMKKRLVIIPAFNEVGSIERTVEDIKKNAPSFDYVIINDHSMDGTKELCDRLGYNMVTLSINSGIGAAVQTGYLYGHRFGYDYAIQIDGDGQHDAKFLEKMADVMEAEEINMLIGSRFIEGEGFQSTGLRRVGIHFFTWLIRLLTGKTITDPTSGDCCDRVEARLYGKGDSGRDEGKRVRQVVHIF